MSIHHEISFETEICQHLSENGWLHAEGDAAGYDRKRAIYPPDLLAWVQETQPKAWEGLVKNRTAHWATRYVGHHIHLMDQNICHCFGVTRVKKPGPSLGFIFGKGPTQKFYVRAFRCPNHRRRHHRNNAIPVCKSCS